MKNTITGAALLLLWGATGCLPDSNPQPEVIIDPPMVRLVERDSISTGEYLGIRLHTDAASAYAAIQAARTDTEISHLNIVSNISSEISQLETRIPLYSYILLDQQKGTDSGVQITLESGKVKSIYLNSGKSLSQWPEKEKADKSVRIGDPATALFAKLVNISKSKKYAGNFERISLLTKNLDTSYDPVTAASPQWYFVYRNDRELLEEVQLHLKDGQLDYVLVNRYK